MRGHLQRTTQQGEPGWGVEHAHRGAQHDESGPSRTMRVSLQRGGKWKFKWLQYGSGYREGDGSNILTH